MPRNPIPWQWTKQREDCAKLVADDLLPDREISKRVGISDITLYEWRKKPEFMARVDSIVSEYRARIRRSGIAVVENRIAKLAEMEQRMQRLIEARATAYANPDIPGGDTGLVIKRVKGIGALKQFRVVEEYEFDKGLANEYREYLKQAAQDLGQWAADSNEGKNAALDFLKTLEQQMKNGPAKTEENEEEK